MHEIESVLQKLGVEHAQGMFVTTGDDNTNLVICLTARQINPAMKIVARSKEIVNVKKLKRAGADRVVTPNYIGGMRMAAEMLRPTVTTFLDEMLHSDLNERMEEFIIPESKDGKNLLSFPAEELKDTLIIAIRENDRIVYNPKKDHILKQGATLIMITTPKERRVIDRWFL
jgi:voltage-gated potassium channel